jgi:hypothetical protein
MKDLFRYIIAGCFLAFVYATSPEPRTAPLGPDSEVVEVVATPLPVEPLEVVPEPTKEIGGSGETGAADSYPKPAVTSAPNTPQYRPPVRYYTAPQSCSGPNCQAPQRRQGILKRWRRS